MDDDAATMADFFDHLVRAQILLWNAVDDRLRADHDLPLSWFEPMRVVARREHARVRDVATTLLITDGGASKLVDRITAAGFLDRHRHPADGRATRLELTESGRAVLAAAEQTFGDELSRRLGPAMTRDALAHLGGALGDLRRSLAEGPDRDDIGALR